jgi:spermidine synthase
MLVLGSRSRPSPAAAPEAMPWQGAAAPEPDAARPLALLLFGLSGAVALVFEITWARVFGLVFGSSVYSFALVLAAYLLALALGSMLWGGRLADGPRPWRAFAFLQVAAGAGAVIGLWALPHLPRLFLTILMEHRAQLASLFLLQTALASLVTFLPCLAFGALFPVGTRLVAGGRLEGARATGVAYAVNTAGTLTGSLAAGFVFLPHIGVHATWVGAAILSLVLGLVAWRVSAAHEKPVMAAAPLSAAPKARGKAPAPKRPKAARGSLDFMVAPAAIVVVVAAILAPPWNKSLFTLGVFRTAFLLNAGLTSTTQALRNMDARLANDQLLFYKEGLHGVVSVHADRGAPGIISLRVNGKPDASTSVDIGTQVFLGHVPMLWAPPQARVCVIGQGSGVTARAALMHDPERLTVVEIEPAVVTASHFFDAWTDTVLADPRVELILEDGRQHLLHSGRHYDVIVSEPSNPWIAGVNNLFTTDFYERVKAALTAHGTFCQWVQFYELSPLAQSSLLSSFAHVFPQGEAFFINFDLLLVAPPAGEKVAGDRLFVRGSGSPVERYLHRFQLDGDGAVAAIHLGRVSDLVAHLPPAPLNTDDRPYIEYRAPLDLYQVPVVKDAWELASSQPLAGLERWVAPSALTRAAGAAGIALAHAGQIDRAKELARELAHEGGQAGLAAADVAQAAHQAEVEQRTQALLDRGDQALDAGDFDGARRASMQLFNDDPQSAAGNLLVARMAMRKDSLEVAKKALSQVMTHGNPPLQSAAHQNLGIIAMREGRAEAGRAEFLAALALTPSEPKVYLYLARLQLQSGQRDSAQATLVEGINNVTLDSELRRALEALQAGQTF